jgi:hypothetical protein
MGMRLGLGGYLNLWVFATAFGLMEAIVVVFLRQIAGTSGGNLFPVLQAPGPAQQLAFSLELLREAASLVVMLGPALLTSSRAFERLLAYALVFGVWDISYYVFLRVLIGWPDSLLTYDVLFLIPTLWVAPVICPVLISAALIASSTAYWLIAQRRAPRNPSVLQWLLAVLGGALVQLSFVDKADYYRAGGMPPNFSWLLFAGGFALAAVAAATFFVRFWNQPRTRFF